MKKLIASMRRHKTATWIMLIVFFLAFGLAVAIPYYKRPSVDFIMAEGVLGAELIRGEMRCFLSTVGSYRGAFFSPWLNEISIGRTDLEGKYFAQTDYSLIGVTSTQYMIRVGPPSRVKGCGRLFYTLDQDDVEHGPYYSSASAAEKDKLLAERVYLKTSYIPHPVPYEVVRKLPGLVNELKLGATREQVFRQLGLWDYQDDFRNLGDTWRDWEVGLLQQEKLLLLAFETTAGGIGGFQGAVLFGSSWTAAEKEMSQPPPNLPWVMGPDKSSVDWHKW